MADMTAAPISAADREKAHEQIAFALCSREECLCESGEFEWRCLDLADQAEELIAGQFHARVVELEAEVKRLSDLLWAAHGHGPPRLGQGAFGPNEE